MPKLNLYTSTQVPEGYQAPRLASIEEAGATEREAARGILAEGQQVSGGLMGIYNQQQELARRQEEAKAQVEAIQLQSQYERELVNTDIKMRQDPKYDYTTHPDKFDEAGTALISKYQGMATTQLGAQKFGITAERALKEKVVGMKYQAANQLNDQVYATTVEASKMTAADVAGTIGATNDGFLTPLQNAKIDERVRLNTEWGQRYNQEKEAARLNEQLKMDVDRISASRAIDPRRGGDPAQFLIDVKDLNRWKNLTGIERERMEERAGRAAEQQSKIQEKTDREYSAALRKYFVNRMDGDPQAGEPGVNVDHEIRMATSDLTAEDQNFLIERNKKIFSGEKTETDKMTRWTLQTEIQSGRLRTPDKIIANFNKLSTSDGDALLTMQHTENRRREDKAESERDQQISANLHKVESLFATTNIMDIDRDVVEAKGQAMSAYLSRARANTGPDANKHPSLIADEVRLQYAKTVQGIIGNRRPTLPLGMQYLDMDSLNRAYNNGKGSMSQEAYMANRTLIQYNDWLSGLQKDRTEAARQKAEQARQEENARRQHNWLPWNRTPIPAPGQGGKSQQPSQRSILGQ